MQRAPRPSSGPKRPPGPATFLPKQPASAKQRRAMIKAAAWRLARLLRVRPAELVAENDLAARYQLAFPKPVRGDGHGQAARLIAKIMRLRKTIEA